MVVFNQVTIIGVGLIGGSLALSARRKGIFHHIIGVGRTLENLQKAKELQVVDDYTTDLTTGVTGSDLVVVATPVRVVVPLIEKMLPHLKEGTIITDVGSVKAEIVNQVGALPLSNVYFVGGHPIAGTENSGAEAAFSDLFKGRKCILTPTKRTDIFALEKIRNVWEAVGAEVVLMDSAEHDKILGAVSHLPHMIAFTLVNFLDELQKGNGKVFEFSAGGLKDFTRIAASHPVMWADIAVMNRAHLVELMEGYQNAFDYLKTLIDTQDWNRLHDEIQKSRIIRRTIIV
ncbi:MAG: prephenate dehydrogenase/arogenate dehydrogenase family protein [Pseudomonadota bacterium]